MSHSSQASDLVFCSPAMTDVLQAARRVAATASTVLICGESGTGKEVLARAVHQFSARAHAPFVSVDCGSIPAALMESELFGHEAGAYTDARTATRGLLETAGAGTVLLDEVGLMPLQLQAKLLHVLETHSFRRVGGDQEIPISARFIGATNEDLEQAVDAGRFRLDLFYRLNVLRINLPPLRERVEDIVPIARNTIEQVSAESRLPPPVLGSSAIALLNRYSWPGNVRELRNVVERAVVMTDRGVIRAEDLEIDRRVPRLAEARPLPLVTPGDGGGVIVDLPAAGIALEEVEKQFVLAALQRTSGKVAPAARLLRLTRETLRYRITRHGIDPGNFHSS